MKWPWGWDQERWDEEHRWTRLGTYNAEISRGIVHTPEYDDRMKVEQAEFDARHRGPCLPRAFPDPTKRTS